MGQFNVGEYNSDSALGPVDQRFFYALRTDDEGTLYFTRVDQWTETDTIEINKIGPSSENWDFFEIGIDFFDGKDSVTHDKTHDNLVYDQYRFDSRSVFYYINATGELVVRFNQSYNYPSDV